MAHELRLLAKSEVRQRYTQEFKQEAVRQIESEGKSPAQVARELGVAEQILSNWRKASTAGKLGTSGGKPISPEQMELSRLRAENAQLPRARVPREHDALSSAAGPG